MGDKENLLELDEDCPPEDEVFEEKKDEKVIVFLNAILIFKQCCLYEINPLPLK